MYICITPVGEITGAIMRKRFLLYPWFEVWKISSKEDEDNVALILLVHVHGKHSLCQYITLQRGTIVYLFILARYFQTPESDE